MVLQSRVYEGGSGPILGQTVVESRRRGLEAEGFAGRDARQGTEGSQAIC